MHLLLKMHILKCPKFLKINSGCTSAYSMLAHKVSRKNIIFYVPVQKRQFLMLQKKFLRDIYLSFLHRPHNIFFPAKLSSGNIGCPDAR
jgi:hypothetical protein